jgi:hypothetical protein
MHQYATPHQQWSLTISNFGTIEWGWDTAGYREDRMGFSMGIWGYTGIGIPSNMKPNMNPQSE